MKFSTEKQKKDLFCSPVRNLTICDHHQLKGLIKDLRSNLMTTFDVLGGFTFCRDRKQNAKIH